ncbi:ATP-binding cassette domain-containing protein [Oleidesulfovibrio alaskensis]|uniref:ATP-binding cassette domain-containing protein n=1 Tax=Oleidesulfovibrio alaskensis TaxID=58180 RepID=UPI00041D8FAB|nr:ATP-binding cassette domain-containing protein [Oleidesulfovibrio alaskensis]
MALISVRDVSLNLYGPQLLEQVTVQIEQGERVCLMGRNGQGKSTFLKLLAGVMQPDSGQIVRGQGVRTAFLAQDVPQDITGDVYSVVCGGLGEEGRALAAFHGAMRQTGTADDDGMVSAAQAAVDAASGWERHGDIMSALNHLQLDPYADFSCLSGGMKRRAMLARALVSDPDLLLLDEPTNHLDISSIAWLEDFLLRRARALVFVTHDRAFLRRVAKRIIELDRGRMADWSCDYDTFLERKQAQLEIEEKEWANFDKKLAQEEVWIRQGIKARRTRNMGRVRALQAMRDERRKRRERQGTVTMQMQEAERSGKLVIEADGISYTWPDAPAGTAPVIRDASVLVTRGDKVGIIGPNGAGKTTLLRLLLGDLKPDCGSIRHGTRLEIAYFDQLRNVLDDEASVRESVAGGNDTLEINGVRKHVVGYLKEFLFEPERTMLPVKVLSGGERNRLLLARLFARPSNLLVMDEPTNDLDMETLELLEELLGEYSGTVLIVSHDRAFLNNVVTSTLAFEGGGCVNEYVGGYDDWLRQRPQPVQEEKPAASRQSRTERQQEKPRKLTFNEQRELKQLEEELQELPLRMEALEKEQAAAEAELSDPALYTGNPERFAVLSARLPAIEEELMELLTRWEEAEQRAADLRGMPGQ